MIAMIRTVARFCIAAVAFATVLPAAPSYAQNVAYVSAAGTGSACTSTAPCGFISGAVIVAGTNGRIVCLDGNNYESGLSDGVGSNLTLDIDCPLAALGRLTFFPSVGTTPFTVRIRHLNFKSTNAGLSFQGGGTLILEDCTFTDATTPAVDIEPSGALSVVIKNSRISNNASGILLKPAASGSINATLDHVTIADNTGGGLKIDATNGPVTLDITDSVVSNNGGNGINAVGTASSQNMVSIKNSVIAKNAVAGVQANGANAGVLIATTLLDQNATGALSVAGGGSILTYGNNQIVGSQGANFTGTATLK